MAAAVQSVFHPWPCVEPLVEELAHAARVCWAITRQVARVFGALGDVSYRRVLLVDRSMIGMDYISESVFVLVG